MIQNVILDVDGTLWNTTEIVADAWNEAIEADRRSRVRATPKRLQQLFGKPMNVIGELLFTDVTEEVRDKLLDDCVVYEQNALDERELDILYPGVADTMEEMVRQGKKLFVVSNCQRGYIELFLEKNGFEDFITDFECYGNTGLSKGENIRQVMERNGLNPKETVYVGDTQGDYEATVEADIPFIYASYGFGQVEDAQQSITRFSELLEL